ncbi:hypothetical protein ACWE42_24595 [Sutcliffiella cohnii]
MQKKYNEEDFMLFDDIATDRLYPPNISGGLLGVLMYSAVMNAVLLFARWQSPNIIHPSWNIIVPVSISILIVQAVITFYYFHEKRAFTFQRFQSIFLCFVTIKMSLEGYYIFFTAYEDKSVPTYVGQLGTSIMLGGIVFLILSIIRAVNRVKDGHFREGGNGILNFSQSKSYVSIPIIFGLTMVGGAIPKMLENSLYPFTIMLELYFILLLVSLIQYAIALVWPEFLLLAYCKFKFKSFYIEPPESIKHDTNNE